MASKRFPENVSIDQNQQIAKQVNQTIHASGANHKFWKDYDFDKLQCQQATQSHVVCWTGWTDFINYSATLQALVHVPDSKYAELILLPNSILWGIHSHAKFKQCGMHPSAKFKVCEVHPPPNSKYARTRTRNNSKIWGALTKEMRTQTWSCAWHTGWLTELGWVTCIKANAPTTAQAPKDRVGVAT